MPRISKATSLTAIAFVWLACGGEDGGPTGPSTGRIQVSLEMSGEDLDPDGCELSVDGGSPLTLTQGGSVTFSGLAAGTHSVFLDDVSSNCTVEGSNPRSVSVRAGTTTQVTFSATCSVTTGSLEVTTVTTGADIDPNGYTVTVDSGAPLSIPTNGSTTVPDLALGSHVVGLGGIAENCSVAGSNPKTVTVAAGSTANVAFQVECGATTGSIEIQVTTTGSALDPDGYTTLLDGGSARSVGNSDTVSYANVTIGDHSLELTGIADNCSVVGDNPLTVTVNGGQATETGFTVNCLPTEGTIRVAAVTTGENLDPDGYVASIDGGVRTTRIDPNGETGFGSLAPGDHSVELLDIASNCVVLGEHPRTVTLMAGDTVRTEFEVECALPLTIETASLSDGIVGSDYSQLLSASGGSGEYTWSVVSGQSPPGLSILGQSIVGIPVAGGLFRFSLRVTSEHQEAVAERVLIVYESQTLRVLLHDIDAHIRRSIDYNESSLARNPHLADEIAAKIEMLSEPGLDERIIAERFFGETSFASINGRMVPVAIVFPADTMRAGALADLELLPRIVGVLEEFTGVPWPSSRALEWYGFTLGHRGGGGSFYMEDIGTYANRGVFTHESILCHEAAHTYVGHEILTRFLGNYYTFYVIETDSEDLSDWPLGDYVPLTPGSNYHEALLDIYFLIGPEAMGRAYKTIYNIGAPYGSPLSTSGKQAFVDQAPESVREQVRELVERIDG